MWMMQKLLIPRMQYGQESDSGSEPVGIGGDGEQRLGNRIEKQVVNHLRVAERQGGEFCRQREYNVAVGNRQKVPALGCQPPFASTCLAFRAVPVAARIKRNCLVRAVIAPLDVSTQLSGLACADVAERPNLME
jgi:hypothetical protein